MKISEITSNMSREKVDELNKVLDKALSNIKHIQKESVHWYLTEKQYSEHLYVWLAPIGETKFKKMRVTVVCWGELGDKKVVKIWIEKDRLKIIYKKY